MTPQEKSDAAWKHVFAGRLDEAEALFREALIAAPNLVPALYGMGRLAQHHARHDYAAILLSRAVQFDPRQPQVHYELALSQAQVGQPDAALRSLRTAIELDPKLALAHANLGLALYAAGDIAGAIASLQRAVALDDTLVDAHLAMGMALLRDGQFKQGWTEYEYRFRTTHDPVPLPELPGPRWDGSDPAGKTILVHSEQGLGDAIQFSRYLPLLAQRGAKALFHCPPVLRPLMRSLRGVTIVEDDIRFDAHVPLLSLPHLFGTELAGIPRDVPYLHADEAKVRDWQARLATLPPGRRIGLCWAGKPAHPRDSQRSIPVNLLEPLGQCEGVQWISLQKYRASTTSPTPPAPPLPIHDFTAELGDFCDTAALLMNLDLVITVDTSVAHLAGALGKPVWNLITFVPHWRWMMGRGDSPWYPTMRLFRQPYAGDWPSVIAMVRSALEGNP